MLLRAHKLIIFFEKVASFCVWRGVACGIHNNIAFLIFFFCKDTDKRFSVNTKTLDSLYLSLSSFALIIIHNSSTFGVVVIVIVKQKRIIKINVNLNYEKWTNPPFQLLLFPFWLENFCKFSNFQNYGNFILFPPLIWASLWSWQKTKKNFVVCLNFSHATMSLVWQKNEIFLSLELSSSGKQKNWGKPL